jgi:hypothetical protein
MIIHLAATFAFSCDMSAAPGAPGMAPGAAPSGAVGVGAVRSGPPRGMPAAAAAAAAACLFMSSSFRASTFRFVASSIAASCTHEQAARVGATRRHCQCGCNRAACQGCAVVRMPSLPPQDTNTGVLQSWEVFTLVHIKYEPRCIRRRPFWPRQSCRARVASCRNQCGPWPANAERERRSVLHKHPNQPSAVIHTEPRNAVSARTAAKTSKQPTHTNTNPVRVHCIRLHVQPHNMRTCARAHARTAHPAQGQAPHLVLGETTSTRAKPFRCIAIQVLLRTMGVGVRVSHETVTVKRARAGA